MVVDWSKLRWREGESWDIDVSSVTVRQLLDLLDAKKRLKAHKQQKKLDVKIAQHHFDKGGQRWLYEARKRVPRQSHVVRMVAKRLQKGPHDLCFYLRHMELQAVGKVLAHAFNQAVRHRQLEHTILRLDFAKVVALRVNGHHYELQSYHPGAAFVKHRSSHDAAWGAHLERFSRVLHAFSHWTYQETWGKLMVTDFRGAPLKHEFLLSGLALHYWTGDQRFYSADRGKEGMYAFFRTHRCNSHCNELGLKPHRLQPTLDHINIQFEMNQ